MNVSSAGKKVIINIMRTLIVLLIAAALVMIFILVKQAYLNRLTSETFSSDVPSNVIVTDIVRTDGESVKASDSVTDFDVEMNSEWTFESGKSPSEDAYVGNNISNSNDFYFDVTVSGLNQPVYTSPVISPGSHLENIAFDYKLPAGKYNAVMTYYLLGSDRESAAGTLKMALKLTVLK